MTDVVARTVKSFCQAYGVGKTRAYELMARGELEFRKVGDRRLIVEESAKRWFFHGPQIDLQSEPRLEVDTGKHKRKRQYHKSRLPKAKMAISGTVADGSGK